jgi:hypothetical protein
MLFNPNGDDETLAGDRAMEVFKPVFEEHHDGSKTAVRYNCIVLAATDFEYVVSLIATWLSFNQISTVIDSNRNVLSSAGKQKYMSSGEVSCTSRIIFAIAMQLLSDLVRFSKAFSIAGEASTDRLGHAHLDIRIRLPSPRQGKPMLSFHLLAIPLFEETDSGQSLFNFVVRLLDVLCRDWRSRLVRSSTDGAPSLTGSIQGFSTRLASAVLEFGPLFRSWCLGHQLDIIVKGAIVDTQDRANFSFERVLTALIGLLRRQEKLIRDMGSKCPYWIKFRWKSMSCVLKWLL